MSVVWVSPFESSTARSESCDEVEVVLSSSPRRVASDSNAACKRGGNVRPRFFARRKIPEAAFALKKNLCGAWLSKTSDNEQTAAALGDSEKLAVKHTPLNPIPALDHEKPEDFRKVSSVVTTEKSGNILEEEPSGSKLVQDSRKLVNERAMCA